MTVKKPRFPAKCPYCGTPTKDLIAFTGEWPAGKPRPGRHCSRDNVAKWRKHCLSMVCTCGGVFTTYPHHYKEVTS